MSLSRKSVASVCVYVDQNFGQLHRAPGKDRSGLAGMDVFPPARRALDELRKVGPRVALIVPEPLSAEDLRNAGALFGPGVTVVSAEGDLRATLAGLAGKPEFSAGAAVFVAADRVLRGIAAKAGFAAAPHILLAALLARGSRLHFVRAVGEAAKFRRLPSTLPYFWERQPDGRRLFIGVFSDEALSEAVARSLSVERLPVDISIQDPVLVERAGLDAKAAGGLGGRAVVIADDRRLLLALGPEDGGDLPDLFGRHGSLRLLTPSPELLQAPPRPEETLRKSKAAIGTWRLERVEPVALAGAERAVDAVFPFLVPSTAADFEADVRRYSGASDLDASGPAVSRHIQHPDQARVVQALQDELNALGLFAYTHSFSYAGRTLHNVVADMPGTGHFVIPPDILEGLREIFWRFPWPLPDPPGPWLKEVRDLVRAAGFSDPTLEALAPRRLRAALEDLLNIKPWYPWWWRRYRLPGPGAELVILGGHLDSTASGSPGYDPAVDAAPGADDNASGMAATLACARYLANWNGRLVHTVRFCFFHAEEQGMVGSQAYAALLKASGAPVKAALLTDMIGYNGDAANLFEVHAGYTDPALRDLNLEIAETIASCAAGVGSLEPAQIYSGTIGVSGADRTVYDAAINRSDHASFHQQGYPAVVVSEDYFVNLPTEPGADPNPDYHTNRDTAVAASFGSDIACALAYAVKELAGPVRT